MPPPPSPLTGMPARIWIDSKKAQGTVRRTVPWVSSVHYRIRRGGHWPPVAPLADQGELPQCAHWG